MLKYGIDNVKDFPQFLKGGRVALLTSVTGRSSNNVPTIDILNGMCDLKVLLAPEHGIRGDHADGAVVGDETDPATGLPIYSLFTSGSKHLSADVLDLFDILVYDIQDVGVRFYTFISSLHNVMEDCAARGKRVVVLDRPNPLGGDIVEGGILQKEYKSFVGISEIATRYGLTPGEYAAMINETEKIGCDLKVVPLTGWRRESFPSWNKIWVMPSLALSTFEATMLYAGTCIFEGTTLSEGRGTAAPMRIIGGPGMDGEKLLKEFHSRKLEGVEATPVYFAPTASKHTGNVCGGLMLHVTDYDKIRPVTAGVELLDTFIKLYPEKTQFLPPYNPGGRRFITLLTGCGDFIHDFDSKRILDRWQEESAVFKKIKRQYHMY